jgi:hypothetical protein
VVRRSLESEDAMSGKSLSTVEEVVAKAKARIDSELKDLQACWVPLPLLVAYVVWDGTRDGFSWPAVCKVIATSKLTMSDLERRKEAHPRSARHLTNSFRRSPKAHVRELANFTIWAEALDILEREEWNKKLHGDNELLCAKFQ